MSKAITFVFLFNAALLLAAPVCKDLNPETDSVVHPDSDAECGNGALMVMPNCKCMYTWKDRDATGCPINYYVQCNLLTPPAPPPPPPPKEEKPPEIEFSSDPKPQTSCQLQREEALANGPMIGMFVAACTDDGGFESQQCDFSTGHCWCVDEGGIEQPNTRRGPGEAVFDCDGSLPVPAPPTPSSEDCMEALETVVTNSIVPGAFMPHCDDDGGWVPLQCHGSTGECWCVDTKGAEVSGTRSAAGQQPPECAAGPTVVVVDVQVVGPCTKAQDEALSLGLMPGLFVPHCTDDGAWFPLQCDGSSGECWCVDIDGNEVPGSRSIAGAETPVCDGPGNFEIAEQEKPEDKTPDTGLAVDPVPDQAPEVVASGYGKK